MIVPRCVHRYLRGRCLTAVMTLLVLAIGLWLAASAAAYVPSLKEIYARVAQRQPPIERAVIVLRSRVFDPISQSGITGGGMHPDAEAPEWVERSFTQKIWWIRNVFLGIETFAPDGTLLHFYLHEGFRAVHGPPDGTPPSAGSERPTFSEADVVHPFLAFVAADPAAWRQAVSFWGVNPRHVDIARGSKGEPYYRLVEDDTRALWLEPELLRPVKLETRLLGGQDQTLTLEFHEFLFIGDNPNDADNFYFPRTVNYLLNGRLFKQTVVVDFDSNPSVQGFPISRMRQLAARITPERAIPLAPIVGARP